MVTVFIISPSRDLGKMSEENTHNECKFSGHEKPLGLTLLPTKKDGHRNVGDQFHLLLALLGVLSWSRLVAPLRPSNFFYLMVYGDFLDFHVVPPVKSGWKKLKGPRGPTCINQHRTPRSTRKRWNWSPTFRCPSLFVRSSVLEFSKKLCWLFFCQKGKFSGLIKS